MAKIGKITTLLLFLLTVCASSQRLQAETSVYVFDPNQSTVVKTGGFAGVHITYAITGQFQLTVDSDAGVASFEIVDANLTEETDSVYSQSLDEIFNMTGLGGTVIDETAIEFGGKTADGTESDVRLKLSLSDGSIHLAGNITPPPNSADMFFYDVNAVATRKYAAGTGMLNDPYQIATAEDLITLGETSEDYDKHFILTADIDLDPNLPNRKVFDKAVIAPAPNYEWQWFLEPPFTGVFNGNDFEIRNMMIEFDEHPDLPSNIGLFGAIDEESIIKSLKLVNASVNPINLESFVGELIVGVLAGASKGLIIDCRSTECDAFQSGLVGKNYGDIVDCHSSGAVSGGGGGLVKSNSGNIINCTSSCDVAGYKDIGGLVGRNIGKIENSYASGSVEGTQNVGGLVGYSGSSSYYASEEDKTYFYNYYGSILNCYATGSVNGHYNCLNIGGLVGTNESDMIYMSYALGDVAGDMDSSRLGGLVGNHNGNKIVYCYASGTVKGESVLGGLIGYNRGYIECCYAAGDITGNTDNYGEITVNSAVGGLVGYNYGNIVNSYAIGKIVGHIAVGGLIGKNGGAIKNSYATGKTNSPYSNAGGLVGVHEYGSIDQCYFLDPDSDNGLGELLTPIQMQEKDSFEWWDFYMNNTDGLDDHWYLQEGDYPVLSWQTEMTGLKRIPDVNGLSLDEAHAIIENTGLLIGDTTQTDFHEFIPKGDVIYTTPTGYSPADAPVNVIISDGPYDWTTNDGDGSENNPYVISSSGQLQSIKNNPDILNSHFVLTNDIDMHSNNYTYWIIGQFNGKLDGFGYRIFNFNIKSEKHNRPYQPKFLGFFYDLGKEAEIKNLNLENAFIWPEGHQLFSAGLLAAKSEGTVVNCHSFGIIDISPNGSMNVGGLVGDNGGYISNCSANAQIKGYSNFVGGLVGVNRSNIATSYSTGEIIGNNDIGGLVGWNKVDISDCYSTCGVRGNLGIGGLVGINYYSVTSSGGRGGGSGKTKYYTGRITSSYSIGRVTGTSIGGLVGGHEGNVSSCFWDIQTSGISEHIFEGEPSIGLETTKMQTASTFLEAGWDFMDEEENGTEDIWWIDEGQDYPRLWWEAHD